MQSKRNSFIEACTNTAVGYLINLVAQIIVFRALGIPVSLHQNIKIGLIFTVISIMRGYVLRRWFTKKTESPSVIHILPSGIRLEVK